MLGFVQYGESSERARVVYSKLKYYDVKLQIPAASFCISCVVVEYRLLPASRWSR